MPERSISPEKAQRVASAHRLSSVAELSQLGNPSALLDQIGTQVSQIIKDYNHDHPHEMLPKSPVQIIDQFNFGNSVVILSINSPVTVLYHASLYPIFSSSQSQALGCEVVEFGSAITHPHYRNGYGLGVEGAKLRLKKAQSLHPHTLSLSTNKQELTTRVLEHAGMQPVNFWDYPYLAYLTCTCTHCSESFGFPSCSFRRPLHLSSPQELNQILDRARPAGKMPCTLVVSDQTMAADFETRCRQLHSQSGCLPLIPGRITPETMQSAKNFFDRL